MEPLEQLDQTTMMMTYWGWVPQWAVERGGLNLITRPHNQPALRRARHLDQEARSR